MYRFILLLLATQPLAYQALRDPKILAPYGDNFRSSPTESPTKAYPTGLNFTAGSASTTDFKVGDNSLHAQRPTPHAQRHTPNATRHTPNAKRQTPNVQCPMPKAQRSMPRYKYNFNLPLDLELLSA
jgi:hypothetical protein